jgi:hypothetical protein
MEEKRQFIRFKILLKGEFEFAVGAGTKIYSKVQLIDFSRAGVRIFIPKHDFTKTNSFQLKVSLPNRPFPILIQGAVRWIQPKDDGWEIGAKIGQIDPADKGEILDYAYKLWKEKIAEKK